MATTDFGSVHETNRTLFRTLLRVDASFDVVQKDFIFANREASLFFIDGFAKDDSMDKMLQNLTKLTPEQLTPIFQGEKLDADLFAKHFITYIESAVEPNADNAVVQVLSGVLCLLVQGCDKAILIDARSYPTRSIGEPDNERTLRGSHDGFGETLIFNTALIRRRIRDPKLTMEYLSLPGSHTDLVLCYVADVVDQKLLDRLRKKLHAAHTRSIHMGQESLIETLIGEQWFNPFPRVRYTERPDSAAASVAEGQILLLCDTAPQGIILPCSLFTFLQDINDFYFPPLVGTYLRWVRLFVAIVTLFLTPVWYLLSKNPDIVPGWLEFMIFENKGVLPILMQFILIELLLDGLKLASLNTPSALSSSFSIVGALLLGDLAIQAGWFSPEVVLYMSFVAVANFTLTSFELSYALKFNRILMLVLTSLLDYWGFGIALVLLILQLFTVKTLDGYRYMAPLIPFDGKTLFALLVRKTKKG